MKYFIITLLILSACTAGVEDTTTSKNYHGIESSTVDEETIKKYCSEIKINQSPVDISLVTSILYPGQIRGNDYKAHGGFRFDESDNEDINIRSPVDGIIVRASRYIENNEVQYLFDIMGNCGVEHRFDHLRKLSPKLQQIADTLPPAKEDDSRTANVENVKVSAGELLATSVGLSNNVFVDWGVYDLNNKNKASENSQWEAEFGNHQTSYAICWLELLPENIRDLPGSGESGKTSDYC